MDSLTIKRQVAVKVKVTEDFKKQMVAQLQETARKLDLELQNIEFQSKRTMVELDKKNPNGKTTAKKHLEEEKIKRVKAKEQLMEQIKQIGKLPIGSEVHQGNLDTITELKVGDSWSGIFGVEVVVCDDHIIEIREKSTVNGD